MMSVPEKVISILPYFVLVLVGIIGIVALLLGILRRGAGSRIERKAFLTRAEVEVLGYLRQVLPRHHVSCQVLMAVLLKPQRGLSRKELWRTRNRFCQKIVGLVSLTKLAVTIVAHCVGVGAAGVL